MILLRKLYCVGCRKNTLHIIYVQKKNQWCYHLTCICLDVCCVETRQLTLVNATLADLCARTREDEPKTKGGI